MFGHKAFKKAIRSLLANEPVDLSRFRGDDLEILTAVKGTSLALDRMTAESHDYEAQRVILGAVGMRLAHCKCQASA